MNEDLNRMNEKTNAVPKPIAQPQNAWTSADHFPKPAPRVREVCGKRDMGFALCFVLLSILVVNFFLWGGSGIAASVAVIGLYAASVLYIMPYRVRFSPYCITCMVLYVLCAVSLVASDSAQSGFYATVAIILLFNLTLLELRPLRKYPAGTFYAIGDWLNITIVQPLSGSTAAFYALFHRKDAEGTVSNRRIGSVILGLLCALPPLLIIIPLLISADVAFKNLLKILTFDSLTEIVFSLIFGLLLFSLVFSQHFTAKDQETATKEERQNTKGIEPTIMNTFFGVICVVYVLYLFSQLAYFFSAFSGLLPKGYTVAEYARRGFFEMTAVCVINLCLVIGGHLAAPKKDGKEPLSIRLFSLFFCIFSLVLVATAMSKMFLYIGSFGMTHKRILTALFMVFLAVVFISLAIRLFARKLPYLKIALIAGMLLIIFIGFADIDRMVAKYNVEAYLSGKLDSVDMQELSSLDSDGIVPYVWKLTKVADRSVSDEAYEILYDKLWEHDMLQWDYDLDKPIVIESRYDWRGYNIPEYEAFELLRENAERIIERCNYYRDY